jgi:DHA1 family tetracycline resistance protein-like MFS transporter
MQQKNAMLFIFIVIALDATGLGIIIPSLPSLVAETAHVSLEQSASYYMWILGAYAAMQFFFAPIVGGLSDRFGRRPILLISMLGLAIDYVFMYFAPDIAWLFLGRCISGALGASYTTAAAYIADVSTPENKTRNFGMIGAAFGLGFVIGPAIGGLLGHMDIRSPFLLAAGLALLNFVYGLFVLKESLPQEHRRPFNILRSNVVGSVVQIFRYKSLGWLFLVIFLYFLGGMAIQSTWVYYTQEKFAWTRLEVGISLSIVGVCIAIVQGGFSGFFSKRMGEIKTSILSLTIFLVAVVAIGLSSESWMLYALMLPYAFSGLAGPSIQSIMSNNTADNAQGELQGSITGIMSIAEVIGPLMMMEMFALTTVGLPSEERIYGSPYFLGGIMVFLSLMFFLLALRRGQTGQKKSSVLPLDEIAE